MAVRSILNHSLPKITHFRLFSSSTAAIYEHLYKQSLPVLPTPWLMLPTVYKDGVNTETDNYWNILDKSTVKMDRPVPRDSLPYHNKCLGTTRGWLIFIRDDDRTVLLTNPYAEAITLKLPYFPYGIYRNGFQFTLAGNPMSKNFKLLIDGSFNSKNNTLYQIHCDRSSKIMISIRVLMDEDYGKTKTSRVLSLSLGSEYVEKYLELSPWEYERALYLVVAEDEDDQSLFLVLRRLATEKGVEFETKDIDLFRVDLESSELECVESIGDRALFLGRHSDPFFLSTRECTGIKSNCVYIAGDLGIYDLETKQMTPFLSVEDLAIHRHCFYWVAPPSFL